MQCLIQYLNPYYTCNYDNIPLLIAHPTQWKCKTEGCISAEEGRGEMGLSQSVHTGEKASPE